MAEKLTPLVRMILVDACRTGLSRPMAAARAGIAQSTLYAWIERGIEERNHGRTPHPFVQDDKRDTGDWAKMTSSKQSRYVELVEALDRADANRLHENLLWVRQAAQGGAVVERTTTRVERSDGSVETTTREKVARPEWQAAAWNLERTKSSDYGTKTRTELTGKDGGPIEVGTFASLVKTAADEERKVEDAARKKKS